MAAVIRQCDNWKQNFKKKQQLKRHMLHCVKNAVVTCDFCQKTFGLKDNLKRHALICGKKDEKHCHESKKDFRSPYHLKRHLEQVHFEKDTYTCENCKKVYHRKDFYQSHIIKCNGNFLPVKSHMKFETLKIAFVCSIGVYYVMKFPISSY